MASFAEKVADKLGKEGIGIDLIDPRTTSPLDEETILGRAVAVYSRDGSLVWDEL